MELKDHPNPYELSGRNRESYDKVTKQCTFKYAITKDIMDEMTCDVVPMDCTNILVSIHFLHDRKDHIIPYQEKCIVTKDEESFVIHDVPTPSATSLLVNKAQAKRLVQAS